MTYLSLSNVILYPWYNFFILKYTLSGIKLVFIDLFSICMIYISLLLIFNLSLYFNWASCWWHAVIFFSVYFLSLYDNVWDWVVFKEQRFLWLICREAETSKSIALMRALYCFNLWIQRGPQLCIKARYEGHTLPW